MAAEENKSSSDVGEEEEMSEDEAEDSQAGCELLIVATAEKIIY